ARRLLAQAKEYAEKQKNVYHTNWLGDLWKLARYRSPEAYISHGWNACLNILDRVEVAVENRDAVSDPCLAVGDGWTADEAFGAAMLCFLTHPDDALGVIDHAALARGAFAGAHLGLQAWPADLVEQVQYHDQLMAIVKNWDAVQYA